MEVNLPAEFNWEKYELTSKSHIYKIIAMT